MKPKCLVFTNFHGVTTTNPVNFRSGAAALRIKNLHCTDTIDVNKLNNINDGKM